MKYAIKPSSMALLLSAVLLLCFQNCGQGRYGSVVPNWQLKNQNNGGSYEGKVDNYYRFASDYTCEQQTAPIAIISISEINITLTFNQPQKCASDILTLSAEAIDSSLFQTDVIGYRGGIYERKEIIPSIIPDRIIESWCRNYSSDLRIETLSYYSSSMQNTTVKMYQSVVQADGSFAEIQAPEFSVTHTVFNGTKQTMTSQNNFSLMVWSDQPSVIRPDLIRGQIETVVNGTPVSREVYCRVGGRFDNGTL